LNSCDAIFFQYFAKINHKVTVPGTHRRMTVISHNHPYIPDKRFFPTRVQIERFLDLAVNFGDSLYIHRSFKMNAEVQILKDAKWKAREVIPADYMTQLPSRIFIISGCDLCCHTSLTQFRKNT